MTSARRTSITPGGAPPGRPTVKKRKTESKGVPLESIINIIYANMSDEGIRKMFDQCSDDFFIAVEDELGEIRKGRFLIHPSFTLFFMRVISLLKVGQKFVLARKNLFNSEFTSTFG